MPRTNNNKTKKNQRRDARGNGGTGSSVPNTTTTTSTTTTPPHRPFASVQVTARNHDDLVDLVLRQSPQPPPASSSSAAAAAVDNEIGFFKKEAPALGRIITNNEPPSHHYPTTTTIGVTARSHTPVVLVKKRLALLVDSLLDIGFTMEDVERVCVALGPKTFLSSSTTSSSSTTNNNNNKTAAIITLEEALDWFCWHYPPDQLPNLLTEVQARRQQRRKDCVDKSSTDGTTTCPATGIDPLTVILAGMKNKDGMEEEFGALQEKHHHDVTLKQQHLVVKSASWDAAADESNPVWLEEESQQQQQHEETAPSRVVLSADEKSRLLAQYQYVDNDDDDDDDEHNVSITDASGACAPVTTSSSTAASATVPHSPTRALAHLDVARLEEVRKELDEAERDAADEASNYMRSKYEIKELQKRVKQLRKQVQGLQRKVDRLSRERVAHDETTSASASASAFLGDEVDVQVEDVGSGMFDIFGDTSQDGVVVSKESTADTQDDDEGKHKSSSNEEMPSVNIPMDAIPKSWTGKTPRVLLVEQCRKKKTGKPRYEKLHANGCRLTLPELTLETRGIYSVYSLVQEYTATRVLYETNPDLPLYRLLPPFFSDLWKKWLADVQQEKESAEQEELRSKRATIDRLIEMMAKSTSSSVPRNDMVAKIEQDCVEDNSVDDIPGSWDSDAEESADGAADQKVASKAGADLRMKFRRTQETQLYRRMLDERQALPVYGFRDRILQNIQKQPVTILCADTGAGKSTQCPQYILEEALLEGSGDKVSVLCTQPRRVAATSVAERVSEEMGEPRVGGMVGYQIRLEAKKSARTKLLFCTTGVVVRRLQEDSRLTGITHVVVDEVHERQYQIDVLLLALRQLVNGSRPDLKVILMSATLDADLFCAFFHGAPLVSVPGRTFPVSNYYLEDLLDATDSIIEEGSPYAFRGYRRTESASLWVTSRGGEKRKQTVSLESEAEIGGVSDEFAGYKMSTRRSMDRVDEERINYDLIEDVLRLLVDNERKDTLVAPEGADLSNGSILIFLPGIGEIRTLVERLEGSRDLGNTRKFDVIPLHSSLSAKDQRRAFAKPKLGCCKIIVSTNIAETSVTIPDVVCVMDSGRVREVRQNKRKSTSRLMVDWCSRASAKQRAGRAGRVQPGICLKLFSSRTHRVVMKDASEPELRRVPLEEVCLGILAGGFASSCMDFLQQAPQPPTDEAVMAALRVLEEVGAVELTVEKKNARPTETLTPLGRHLSKLPIHVRLGKMLIFGSLFQCLDPILTVAAGLSCQSPFASFWDEANEAKAKHRAFADARSDFMTLCHVWRAYCQAAVQGQARKFISLNYLSRSALGEIRDMREHFIDLLCDIGFLDRRRDLRRDRQWHNSSVCVEQNRNSQSFEVVHAVICAGLYPNVAQLTASSSQDRSLVQNGQLLQLHSSSVNRKLTSSHGPSLWMVFFEKFETNRVWVRTTSPIHPFAMILFGGNANLVVKHLERKVVLNDWIELGMAAQTGVLFRELRNQWSKVLANKIATQQHPEPANSTQSQQEQDMVDGIVKLLSSGNTTS